LGPDYRLAAGFHEHQHSRRDLLLQTSGIAGGYVGGWVAKLYAEGHLFVGDFNNADLAERIGKLPLTRQPGTFWRYGYSADVLGRVIEVASDETVWAPVSATTIFTSRVMALVTDMAWPCAPVREKPTSRVQSAS